MKQLDEGNLFTDLMEIGPAPTPARELVVAVISVALIAVLIAIVGVSVPTVAAAAVVAAFLAVRVAVGRRHWGRAS